MVDRNYKIYCVDFDNTLAICEDIDCTKGSVEVIPVSKPNTQIIEFIKSRQAVGDKFILWTCRNGTRLDYAVEWCRGQGLVFDAVNCNLPEIIELWGLDTRKVWADEYIDNKSGGDTGDLYI